MAFESHCLYWVLYINGAGSMLGYVGKNRCSHRPETLDLRFQTAVCVANQAIFVSECISLLVRRTLFRREHVTLVAFA
jgi:hypothetical protein